MTATNFLETGILKLIFNGTPIDNLAINTNISPATSFYISLHTADPQENGSQEANEATYTSYARVGIGRNSGAWIVTNNNAQNSAVIDFPTSTGGSSMITHFGIGTAETGPGTLLFVGNLANAIDVTSNTTPSFNSGNLIVTAE